VIAESKPVVRVVIYEGEGSTPLEPAVRAELSKLLLEQGYSVSRVKTGSAASAVTTGSMVVIGQFNKQKPGFATGADGAVKVHFREVAGLAAPDIVKTIEACRGEASLPKPGGWKPWFPVIDYGRCTNCMQCLSFCLFDVYGVSTVGKIQVRNENHCKTDCPACSRVCPEVAILFPKYRSSPINGDEVNADDLRREAMKVDISALLGGDIYQALRDRSAKAQSRFSKERDEERALKERQRCLTKLSEKLDIPAEVLSSLPSIDQIQAKALQAKARAAEAIKLSSTQPAT
jgi:Pyruvate/2-oxoacid:ferredoxin oxidoreductase delta subunit